MTQSTHVDIYPTTDDLERAVVARVVRIINDAVRVRNTCFIALSGGETPRGVYRRLGRESIDWDRVHVWFGDERMVPPDDPRSNYGMVRTELLSAAPIAEGNVHRIRGEETPETAAEMYAGELASAFTGATDRFDVMLLGLGDDGHTASLFPGTDVLNEPGRPVRAVYVPGLLAWRVTLTYDVINASRAVIFLVSGSRKASIVQRVLDYGKTKEGLPAAMVKPKAGEVFWMLDSGAGSLLPR